MGKKEQICVTYDSELQGSNQFGQLAFIAETKQQGVFFYLVLGVDRYRDCFFAAYIDPDKVDVTSS